MSLKLYYETFALIRNFVKGVIDKQEQKTWRTIYRVNIYEAKWIIISTLTCVSDM